MTTATRTSIFLRFNDDDDPVIVVNGKQFLATGNCNVHGFWAASGDDLTSEVTKADVEAAKASIVLTAEQDAECLRSAEFDLRQQQKKAAVQERWNADLPLWERHFHKGGGKAATRTSSDGVGLRGGGVVPDTEWWEHPTRGKTYTNPEPVTVPAVSSFEDLIARARETKIHNLALAQAEARIWIKENWDALSPELQAAIEAA
jgi:hypothetical protein